MIYPDRRDEENIRDMLHAARTIVEFTACMEYDHYLADRKLQLALERLIDIIGQDATNVSELFRHYNPKIPWQSFISQIHILAAEKNDEKHERMWSFVTARIPELIISIESLLGPVETDLGD
jgi:uncharacterized protein with HEPN domain